MSYQCCYKKDYYCSLVVRHWLSSAVTLRTLRSLVSIASGHNYTQLQQYHLSAFPFSFSKKEINYNNFLCTSSSEAVQN